MKLLKVDKDEDMEMDMEHLINMYSICPADERRRWAPEDDKVCNSCTLTGHVTVFESILSMIHIHCP